MSKPVPHPINLRTTILSIQDEIVNEIWGTYRPDNSLPNNIKVKGLMKQLERLTRPMRPR